MVLVACVVTLTSESCYSVNMSNIKVQSKHVPPGKPILCVQVQVRLQRPTVVAEIGFMLSVTKFFVPGVTMSGVTPTPFESNDVVLEGKPANTAVPEPADHSLQLNISCHVGCIAQA